VAFLNKIVARSSPKTFENTGQSHRPLRKENARNDREQAQHNTAGNRFRQGKP
jgi:hypothetical protein